MPLSYRHRICPDERFANEPAIAFCTGALIAPDLVLTAGHCLYDASTCAETSFAFDYQSDTAGAPPSGVAASNVYRCQQMLAKTNEEGLDFAIVQLDRPVLDRRPLTVDPQHVFFAGQELALIGHPAGLPTKIADHGVLRNTTGEFLLAELDSYGGNSGSPIFAAPDWKMVGMLIGGDRDFDFDGDCRRSRILPSGEGRGEDIARLPFLPIPFSLTQGHLP
jgi:V8-like Glu-specific endopeptidase